MHDKEDNPHPDSSQADMDDRASGSAQDAEPSPNLFPENSVYDLEPIVVPEDQKLTGTPAEEGPKPPAFPLLKEFKPRRQSSAPPPPPPTRPAPVRPMPVPEPEEQDEFSGEESIYELEPFVLPGQELTVREQEPQPEPEQETDGDHRHEDDEAAYFKVAETIYELEPYVPPDQKLTETPEEPVASPVAPADTSAVGTLLSDRYELLDVLGEGATAVVCRARQKATDQLVAIKILKSTDEEHRARFLKEIETHSRLGHKNIVGYIESIKSSDGRMFLVMERIKGISLLEIIKKLGRQNDEENIASILIQVLEALEHAHERRIIHRDLKSGNIILMKENNGDLVVKLLDFGISKFQDEDQRLTQAGQALGSPVYMSPEQCMGQVITTRSDLYSLGIVAYEMVTGKPPYMRRSVINIMAAHCDETVRPDPIKPVAPELKCVKVLEQILLKALETNADKRFQSATQFKEAVTYWIEQVRAGNEDAELPAHLLETETTIAITEIDECLEESPSPADYAPVPLEPPFLASGPSQEPAPPPQPVPLQSDAGTITGTATVSDQDIIRASRNDAQRQLLKTTQELRRREAYSGKEEKAPETKSSSMRSSMVEIMILVTLTLLIGIAIGHYGTVHWDEIRSMLSSFTSQTVEQDRGTTAAPQSESETTSTEETPAEETATPESSQESSEETGEETGEEAVTEQTQEPAQQDAGSAPTGESSDTTGDGSTNEP
ncbi:MAG: serine/threonine protein kinase [Cyanobacteria bacterium HKST-UBA02]|nr:serine/threonine protein kinase [Cyanobacteria bacterium HKST-UBA02]